MNGTPLDELIEAIAEGLARPQHFWTLVLVGIAIAVGYLVSTIVYRRTQVHLDTGLAQDRHPDARRFSIAGVRRLAFPLAAQAALWLGEGVLRLTGKLHGTADARLLRLAMMLFGALAVIRLLVYVMRRVFRNLALLALWERALAGVIWVVVALHALGWLDDVVDWLQATALPLGAGKLSLWTLLTGTFSVLVTMLCALWVGSSLEARLMRAESLDSNLRAVLSRVLRGLLLLVAVLVALSMVGIDLTVLSVFGGALGVGLGLGLQRIASNYVSGFIILLDRSLHIGDVITVDKYNGTVAKINTRYTVVRSVDGTQAIVPNEMLVAQAVTNFTFTDKRVRLTVPVTLHYDADVKLALKLMLEAAKAQPRVIADPAPTALLRGFGADGLQLELGFSIIDPDAGQTNLQSDVALAILERFQAAGLVIPLPQRELHLSEAAAGLLPPAGHRA